jgi:hypothetical protein
MLHSQDNEGRINRHSTRRHRDDHGRAAPRTPPGGLYEPRQCHPLQLPPIQVCLDEVRRQQRQSQHGSQVPRSIRSAAAISLMEA